MRALLISLWLVTTCLRVAAQQITLSDTAQRYAVSYPFFLEDRDAALRFEEVAAQNSPFIQSKDKTPDFLGNFSKAIWYRFDVDNNSTSKDWYLEVKGGFMNQLTVYQVSESARVRSLTLTGDQHFSTKPIQSSNLIFPLALPKGTRTVIYVRATTKTLIRTSMTISTMQKLYEDNARISYGDGFFTAVAVALLLYNLFVYFSLREKVYLYYIGYISTAILHTNLAAGHAQLFLPWLDWLNTTTILPVVSFFSILFTNSFLQTRENAPLIYKIRWGVIALCAVPLAFYVAGWYAAGITLSATLIFALFFYWILAAVIAHKKGFAPAIYYLIGFGALVLMSIIFEFKMKGWLPESYWTESSLFIGAAVEAVVLSFALASKFNFYKKEKERLQEQAYQQAIHFSSELINMQEAERKRIASELHDSLGQKMVLIKNRILSISMAGTPPDDSLAQHVAEAIQEIRNISYALRPYQLDLLGLTSSVKSLVEECCNAAQIDYSLQTDNIDAFFDNDASINVYRIIQECLNNIVKHAAAKNISVILKHESGYISIAITDDGIGFDPGKPYAGFGLRGIKERLLILKGTMSVGTGAAGTKFDFLIPITKELINEK